MAQGGIGRASMLLASGTLVSRVLGFVKAIVLAQTIGVVGSASADAFANANMLPSSIYSIIAGGVLNAVLVPQVVRAARHADGGQQYINRLVTLAIAILGGITLVAWIAVPLIAALYGASLPAETLSLVVAFAYWCMPQIFFYGLYAVLGEVLNARGMFGPFTWAPVLNNVIGIAFLWVFSAVYGADPFGQRLAVEWDGGMVALLGSTTTAGVACQALVLFLFWRKVGLTYRPDFQWRGTGLSKAGQLAGWTFGMLLIMQFSGLVETIVVNIASGQAASVAAMQNAYLIFVLPHSIITVSIATAYFTRMSTAASEHRTGDLVRDFSGGARLIGLFIVFAAWAIAVISPPFSRIFESSPLGVTDMAIILCCFLVGLVTFCGLFLVQRAFYALEDTRTQFWLFLATMPLHIFGMAIVATLDVRFIAAGLALMQSIMSALRLALLLWLLRRRIGHLDTRRIVRSYVVFGIGAVAAAAVGFGVMWLMGAYADDGFARSGMVPAFLACAIGGVVMLVVYVAALWLLKSTDLRDALAPVLRRVGLVRLVGAAPADAAAPGVDAQPDAPGSAGATRSVEGAGAPSSVARGWDADRAVADADADADADWGWGDETVGARADAAPTEVPSEVTAPVASETDGARPSDQAWDAFASGPADAAAASYGSRNVDVDRREEAAYGGAFVSMGATGDLSTAGILLPMHATSGTGPRTRRERRELEQRAARALAERRAGADRLEAERVDAERLAAERADAERREAEQQAFERQEAERVEFERVEFERRQASRLEALRLEEERQAAERDAAERGPERAAERRRAHLHQAAADRAADEAFREQQRAAERAQAAAQPAPQPHPERDETRLRRNAPPEAPRAQRRKQADDDAHSLFDELFGDDEELG